MLYMHVQDAPVIGDKPSICPFLDDPSTVYICRYL